MRWESLENGLRVLTPAKLNLYLEIGSRRPDGYHEIDSVFQTISLYDEIEFEKTSDAKSVLEEEGISEGEQNLVLRAARRLRESPLFPRGSRLGARIRLRKGIPEGGGLGGGSSDAAATLLGLSFLWGLKYDKTTLCALALDLGSDVPFFLTGGTARCRGRGEKVESWTSTFEGGAPFHYVLACPRLKISTSWAYDLLDRSRGGDFALTRPSALDSMPPELIREQLRCGKLFFNRFEAPLYSALPELGRLHREMRQEPFLNVLLSGSGSTVYGLCRDEAEASRIVSRLGERVQAEVHWVQGQCVHSPPEILRGP